MGGRRFLPWLSGGLLALLLAALLTGCRRADAPTSGVLTSPIPATSARGGTIATHPALAASPVTVAGLPTAGTATAGAIGRVPFTVDLGDFVTTGELTYPAAGPGPFPAVILIHGSGPEDLDATVLGPDGRPVSRLFRDLADALALHGYAVARYNKHYVTGVGTRNPDYDTKITYRQLVADVGTVYAAARAAPHVDPDRIVLYGWSEGTRVAAQAALEHPAIAGLVLQGAGFVDQAATARYEYLDVGLPFLRDAVDTDRDGVLTLGELGAALQAPTTGVTMRTLLRILLDPRQQAALDTDRDARLDLAREVTPYLTGCLARLAACFGSPAYTFNPLPTLDAALPGYDRPILLLHGAEDSDEPPDNARRLVATLDAAGQPDHTLLVYPGLGHGLGPAPDPAHDILAPLAARPSADLVAWLDRRLRR